MLRRRYIRITDPRTVWFLCQGDPSAAVELATCRQDWPDNQNLRIDVAFHNREDRHIRATSVVKDGERPRPINLMRLQSDLSVYRPRC